MGSQLPVNSNFVFPRNYFICNIPLLRQEENGLQFVDEILEYAFLKKKLAFSLFPIVQSALVHVMAWHWVGIKSLPEQRLTHPTQWHIHVPPGLNLTHWGRAKMADIFQTTFSNVFSWMKMYEFRLKFHWSLFLRVQLTTFQHWFR